MDQDDLLELYAAPAAGPRATTRERLAVDDLTELTASAVCPICNGPMTPRYHPARGPYFHCRCAAPVPRPAPVQRSAEPHGTKGWACRPVVLRLPMAQALRPAAGEAER